MGIYVNVTAKNGCEEQINELWQAQGFQDVLIWTGSRIDREIDYIHREPECAHLCYIKTREQWGKTFPPMAQGRGQVFIASAWADPGDAPEEERALERKVRFILSNRFLFESVTGLRDACAHLRIEFPGDYLDEQGKPRSYDRPTFERNEPRPDNKLYRLCVSHANPELWESFVNFEKAQDWATWEKLRSFIIPWSTPYRAHPMSNVWQACEALARKRDGVDYGIVGRYQQGTPPSLFDVIKVLTPA